MNNYLTELYGFKTKMNQINLDIFIHYQISKKNVWKFEIRSQISLKLLS